MMSFGIGISGGRRRLMKTGGGGNRIIGRRFGEVSWNDSLIHVWMPLLPDS